MKKIFCLCLLIGIKVSSILLASSVIEDESFRINSASRKIPNTNPQLWLHVKADCHSFHKASAQAWVTRGEKGDAAKVAVDELKILLRFNSKKENSV